MSMSLKYGWSLRVRCFKPGIREHIFNTGSRYKRRGIEPVCFHHMIWKSILNTGSRYKRRRIESVCFHHKICKCIFNTESRYKRRGIEPVCFRHKIWKIIFNTMGVDTNGKELNQSVFITWYVSVSSTKRVDTKGGEMRCFIT